MGALCGKESKSDNFESPGRPLGSTPQERTIASLPSNKRVVGGPPRTLGGGNGGEGSSENPTDARRKAAEAAEARAKAANPSGKLGAQLLSQKRMSLNKAVQGDLQQKNQERGANEQRETLNWD